MLLSVLQQLSGVVRYMSSERRQRPLYTAHGDQRLPQQGQIYRTDPMDTETQQMTASKLFTVGKCSVLGDRPPRGTKKNRFSGSPDILANLIGWKSWLKHDSGSLETGLTRLWFLHASLRLCTFIHPSRTRRVSRVWQRTFVPMTSDATTMLEACSSPHIAAAMAL